MGKGAGQIVLDTDFNTIDQSSSLRPVCRLVANATQSIPDNTTTAITFLQEDIDTHNFHSTAANTSRVTPTIPGIYRFNTTIFMPGLTTYTFMMALMRKNGVTSLAPADRKANLVNSVAVSLSSSIMVDMNGTTDYMEVVVQADNTANVAMVTNASTFLSSVFECELVRGPA